MDSVNINANLKAAYKTIQDTTNKGIAALSNFNRVAQETLAPLVKQTKQWSVYTLQHPVATLIPLGLGLGGIVAVTGKNAYSALKNKQVASCFLWSTLLGVTVAFARKADQYFSLQGY